MRVGTNSRTGGGVIIMEIEVAVIGAMIVPIYIALFGIYQKIGKYEEICRRFIMCEQHLYRQGVLDSEVVLNESAF